MSQDTSPRAGLPRVLIVTVNALSEVSNNGKTFASFFEGYPQDRVAQLFFHREAPSSPVCHNYYRIGDEQYFAHLLRLRRRPLGERAVSGKLGVGAAVSAKLGQAKRSDAIRLARTLAWTRLDFADAGVGEWIGEFDPEVVFFCGGDANHLYKPVLDLCERLDIPLVYYITDDYVLPTPSDSAAKKLSRAWTKWEFKRTIARSALVLTIGETMSEAYRDAFGVRSEYMMNLVALPETIQVHAEVTTERPVVSYVGGLHLNRWQVLLDIADSLERLADSNGLDAMLDVYAGAVPPEAEAPFSSHPRLRYQGSLPADAVPEALEASDLLVHVESFDEAARAATLLSVSTKIPEYLAAGTPVLAVGPPEVASMRYLGDAEAALVSTQRDPDQLDSVLNKALRDVDERRQVIEKGIELLGKNHDGARRREWFHNWLSSVGSQPAGGDA